MAGQRWAVWRMRRMAIGGEGELLVVRHGMYVRQQKSFAAAARRATWRWRGGAGIHFPIPAGPQPSRADSFKGSSAGRNNAS